MTDNRNTDHDVDQLADEFLASEARARAMQEAHDALFQEAWWIAESRFEGDPLDDLDAFVPVLVAAFKEVIQK